MARAAPKSKKSKPAPKSKKVEEKEPEVNSEEEKDEQAESEEDEKANNNGSADSDGEDEPPAKRGRPSKGKAGGKKTPVKKVGRPARKTPSKKKEESEDEEDEKEYEVQTILNERTKKGAKEYLVKWKGYSSKDSTWEPESNLNCDDAIAAFQEKQKKAKEIPTKSLREGPKQTERYSEIAGAGDDHRKRHSRRNAKSPRKTYREAPDSD